MQRLILLAAVCLAACSDNSNDTDEIIEEPAEEVYESVSDSVRRPLDEAAEVESLLEERAKAAERAVEEQTQG